MQCANIHIIYTWVHVSGIFNYMRHNIIMWHCIYYVIYIKIRQTRMGPFSLECAHPRCMAFIHQQHPICLKTSAIHFHNIIMPIKENQCQNTFCYFYNFYTLMHCEYVRLPDVCCQYSDAAVHEIRHTIYCSKSCHRSFLLRLALSLSLSLGLLNAAWNTFFCPHSECTCTE